MTPNIKALCAEARVYAGGTWGHPGVVLTYEQTTDLEAMRARLRALADAAEALRRERDALKAAKWDVQHTDTINDMVLIGIARDTALARVAELEAAVAAAERRGMERAAALVDGWADEAILEAKACLRSLAAAIRSASEPGDA